MWYIVLALAIIYLLYTYRDGMDSSPYEMVQEQQGTIQKIHDQLQKITFSETLIQSIQDDNDTLTNQMNDLQANMPSDEPKKQYPN
jgi:uncharacterized membrane-anchored protein